MATLRNGVPLVILLVATAFLAVSAYDESVVSVLSSPPAEPTMNWDQYLAYQEAKQSQVGAQEADVGTLAAPARGRTIVVDRNGRGNYKTIQQAINSIPDGNTKRITIFIKNGVYRQKLLLKKNYVYFKCESRKVLITWGDTAEKAGGTSKSASTAIEAKGFIASDCTFANSAPAPPGGAVGKQAVALRIQGDQGAFYRCAFYGAQDTLYDKEGRHYFRSCYIVGSIDYIFGDGQSMYQFCTLKSIAKGFSGSITAHKRETNSKTGFVFYRSAIIGSGTIYLGRAWGTYSRVIFIECKIANVIRPIGWQDWNDPKRQKTVFYAEYKCSGPGANRKGRARWSKVLTAQQAKLFSSINFINGNSWLTGKL